MCSNRKKEKAAISVACPLLEQKVIISTCENCMWRSKKKDCLYGKSIDTLEYAKLRGVPADTLTRDIKRAQDAIVQAVLLSEYRDWVQDQNFKMNLTEPMRQDCMEYQEELLKQLGITPELFLAMCSKKLWNTFVRRKTVQYDLPLEKVMKLDTKVMSWLIKQRPKFIQEK